MKINKLRRRRQLLQVGRSMSVRRPSPRLRNLIRPALRFLLSRQAGRLRAARRRTAYRAIERAVTRAARADLRDYLLRTFWGGEVAQERNRGVIAARLSTTGLMSVSTERWANRRATFFVNDDEMTP